VGDRLVQSWQEAMERTIAPGKWPLRTLLDQPWRGEFSFAGGCKCEPLADAEEANIGLLIRQQEAIVCGLEMSAEQAAGNLFKVRARIENRTPLENANEIARDDALLRSLVSTHTILHVETGEFVSLIDPPEDVKPLAAACQNVGAWPVLVGEDGERDTMLSSPIILYDYPQIAAESPGDLFDSTEIDEILSLRILSLTDEEKRAAAALDDRVRSLLMRTEALERSQLRALHGAVRGLQPVPAGEMS
jgi:hydrogenase maturation protease